MLCQKCQQRPATVFFSQTVGQQTTQAHLCEACAQAQGQVYGGALPFNFNPFAAFSDFLNNFAAWDEGAIAEAGPGRTRPEGPDPQVQCPHCGYQLSFFRQNGKLGCTKCYESFKAVLGPLVASIHGKVAHAEEPPAQEAPRTERRSQRPEVLEMRALIDAAIKAERYEEAARLRDEIRKIEGDNA